MPNPKKRHHHLIAGQVFFKDKNGEVHAPHINGVLLTQHRTLTARDVGRAQQVLQMNLHSVAEDNSIDIFNVFLFSLSYLGWMTEAEFQAKPKGTVIQTVSADDELGKIFN